MANPARAAPNASSGSVYILTLNAATAAILSEMPAQAHAAVGAAGIAAVASETTAAVRHTRNRAGMAGTPRAISRLESHPPDKPPSALNSGGIQASHACCRNVR